jgi:hypothetical protein
MESSQSLTEKAKDDRGILGPHRPHFRLLRPLVRAMRLHSPLLGVCLRGGRADVRRLPPGLELAVVRPHPESNEHHEPVPEWLQDLANVEVSEKELEEARVEEAACDARMEATPVSSTAHSYAMLAHRWLEEHCERLRRNADPVLSEALDIVTRDAFFVWVKLRRALDGLDRHRRGEEVDGDPVQSDWNGSAKVALVILRSSRRLPSTISSRRRWPLAIIAERQVSKGGPSVFNGAANNLEAHGDHLLAGAYSFFPRSAVL